MNSRIIGLFTVCATLLTAASAHAALFPVTNYNDSGPGSLRQALLDSAASPNADVIEIAVVGTAARVIAPRGQFLPPLVGPLVIRVPRSSASAPLVVLDGSNLVTPRTPSACPGATVTFDRRTQQWNSSRVEGSGPNVRGYFGAGLTVIDSKDVEISGLEIRNFCIGVVTVRSSNVHVHDVKILESHGAAGVMFTGDDGEAGSTMVSFNNRLLNSVLLDNGDGFEFTRGTHDSVLQGNVVALTHPLPADGNAVEFATSGPNNSLIDNTFTGYVSTAVTVGSGGGHTIRGNTIAGNRGVGMSIGGANNVVSGNRFLHNGGAALTVSGTGHKIVENIISGNGGAGVQVTGQNVTMSKNSIVGNGALAIDLAPAGANVQDGGSACADGIPDCDTGANGSQNTPLVDGTSQWTTSNLVVRGSIETRPNATYTIEVFGSSTASPAIAEPTPESGRGAVPDAGPGRDGQAGRGGGGRAAGGGRGGRGAVDLGNAKATERATGQGEKFLGAMTVTTDAKGKGTFALTVPAAEPIGQRRGAMFVSATATDAAGNTSEFSEAFLLFKN